MLAVFHADERPQHCGPLVRDAMSQRDDVGFGETGDRGRTVEAERPGFGTQFGPTRGGGAHTLLVDETVPVQHADDAQHERDIGAGARLDVPVGALSGHRGDRVDDDDAGTVAMSLLHIRPQVAVGEQRVGAPQHDGAGARDLGGICAERHAEHVRSTVPGGHAADVPVQLRGPERCEEPIGQHALLHEPLGAVERVRQHRLATMLRDGGADPVGDLGDRGIPVDRLEPALALGSDAS